MLAFGPVPSRRLGYSLGINNIPYKVCSYSCAYCQVGRTKQLKTHRQEFFSVEQIFQDVRQKVQECSNSNQAIDFLTIVPDGEPTLDFNLGYLIEKLRFFGFPIAVISNASLIDREDVQNDLLQADWVSLKVDSVRENEWRLINRPHKRVSLPEILNGIKDFHKKFQGTLVTETMLVSTLNDTYEAAIDLAQYLTELQPDKSYLSIPIRPPAESWVKAPHPSDIQRVINALCEKIPFLDLLIEAESSDFVSTGEFSQDILSITAVHPIRESALRRLTSQANTEWSVIDSLLETRKLIQVNYHNESFYFRNPIN